jgi:hypothetical protein
MGRKTETAADAAPQTAVELAASAVSQIEAAIANLPAGNPAHAALEAALTDARQNLEVVAAAAALDAQKQAEIDSATAAATAASLSDDVRDAMLAAIEARYAPAAAPYVEPVSTGRKPLNANTVARNEAVATTLASDSAVQARARATIDAFAKDHLPHCNVRREAGTRFASVTAFGGDGVSGRADYQQMATAIRIMLAQPPYNLRVGGQSTATLPWLTATAVHSASGPKGNDSLPLCFADRREVALCPDGRFRLVVPAQAGYRYLRTDGAALAMFNGGANSATAVAPAAPTAPHVPTPPAAPNGAPAAPQRASEPSEPVFVASARCQHCPRRNPVSASECAGCGSADWKAS